MVRFVAGPICSDKVVSLTQLTECGMIFYSQDAISAVCCKLLLQIASCELTLMNILKIVMRANEPKKL